MGYRRSKLASYQMRLERQAAKGNELAKQKLGWLKEDGLDIDSQLEDELEFLRSQRSKNKDVDPCRQ